MDLLLRLNQNKSKNIDLVFIVMLVSVSVLAAFKMIFGNDFVTNIDVEFIAGQGLMIGFIVLFRNHLTTGVKIIMFVSIWMIFLNLGLLRKSLFSPATVFLSFGPLLLSFLSSKFIYRLVFMLMVLSFIAVAILRVNSQELFIDPNVAFRLPGNWFVESVVLFMGGLSIILVHYRNQSGLIGNLEELNVQNQLLQSQNNEVMQHQFELEKIVADRSSELQQAIHAFEVSNNLVAERNLESSMQRAAQEDDLKKMRSLEYGVRRSVRQAAIGRLGMEIAGYLNQQKEISGRPKESSKQVWPEQAENTLVLRSELQRLSDELASINEADVFGHFDLASIIRTSVSAVESSGKTQTKIHFQGETSEVKIHGNPVRVEQVFYGLLMDLTMQLADETNAGIQIEIGQEPGAALIIVFVDFSDNLKSGLRPRPELLDQIKAPLTGLNRHPGHWQPRLQDIGGSFTITVIQEYSFKFEFRLPVSEQSERFSQGV